MSLKTLTKIYREDKYTNDKKIIKRLLDLIVALVAMPFFVIIYIIVGLSIVIIDKGPIFYAGERIGENGKIFKMYKFRSMYVNSPDIRNNDNTTFSSKDDPRVTKIGRLLRATSIDETAQVLNILKGDMSVVGPRPNLPPEEGEYLDDLYWKRLTVKPGITGYTQAYFRNSVGKKERYEMDCYYTENVSFIMDVKILFRTVKTVLLRENLYHEELTEVKK